MEGHAPIITDTCKYHVSNMHTILAIRAYTTRRISRASHDVRVFHPNAPSNSSRSLSAAYKKHEDEKKRAYGERILEIEHGVFTPLVLSTSGGMGREAQTFYKCLADLLSFKRDVPYSSLMGWLRCMLSFAILRSAVMCIRGS